MTYQKNEIGPLLSVSCAHPGVAGPQGVMVAEHGVLQSGGDCTAPVQGMLSLVGSTGRRILPWL